MTLREINDLLLDLAQPYRQSPTFEKIEEPVASEDDSSMTLKVFFDEQIISIICDGEGNIQKKTRKRKLSKEQEDALFGHQMSLLDMSGGDEGLEAEVADGALAEEAGKSGEATVVAESKPVAELQEKPVADLQEKTVAKPQEKPVPRELKSKISGVEEPKSPFKLGDIVCSIYDSSKQYLVDGVSGYVVRCKIIGQLDACYMTSSDLKLVANQHSKG